MVNLRYHIVSITAVFLALGIGLAFGAAFVDRATVEILDRNLSAAERENDDLQSDLDELRARVDDAAAADRELREQGLGQVVSGRLDGAPVVVLAVRGIDEADVRATRDAIVAAGARFGGVLWFTDRLLLDDDGEVADLVAILRLNQADPVRLRASLARRLGTVLAEAAAPIPAEEPTDPDAPVDGEAAVVEPAQGEETAPPPTEPTPEPPLLVALRAAEFVELEPPLEPRQEFTVVPEAGLRIVVVSGPGAVLPEEEFLVPLLERFALNAVPQVGGPVAVAAQRGPDSGDALDNVDPAAERVRFVGLLRADEGLRDRLSTVDDLEQFPGLLAVVLALEYGAAGQYGHYGVGAGAQSLVPPLPPADGG